MNSTVANFMYENDRTPYQRDLAMQRLYIWIYIAIGQRRNS
ncbi:hypothetical protein [Nostoc linckia]|nr:hypothetical protein [Nostoc linckia]